VILRTVCLVAGYRPAASARKLWTARGRKSCDEDCNAVGSVGTRNYRSRLAGRVWNLHRAVKVA